MKNPLIQSYLTSKATEKAAASADGFLSFGVSDETRPSAFVPGLTSKSNCTLDCNNYGNQIYCPFKVLSKKN